MTTVVKASRQDARLVLTIDRPERRNALNAEVIGALQEALDRVRSDETIRAVVLTGAGDEAFCAGADLGADALRSTTRRRPAPMPTCCAPRTLNVPLIARVNGACMAGGIGLLAMCDLAIAARHAIFGLPEAKVGVFPMQVLAVLQAQVPQRCLTQLCLTGDPIEAERARDRPGQRGGGRARRGAGAPAVTRAVQLAHRPAAGLYAMKAMRSMSFEEAIAFGEGQIGLLAMTQDAREGLAAFKEKRKPQWTGK